MPAVARKGDPGATHCSGFNIVTGSSDVFVNGRAVARAGDQTGTHLRPGGKRCVPHTSSISSGSSTVFVNGKPLARAGDPLASCTQVKSGSGDVFAG